MRWLKTKTMGSSVREIREKMEMHVKFHVITTQKPPIASVRFLEIKKKFNASLLIIQIFHQN